MIYSRYIKNTLYALMIFGMVLISQAHASEFKVGFAKMPITPNLIDEWEDINHDAQFDTGIDKWTDINCLLYTSPSPRDLAVSRMPSSA